MGPAMTDLTNLNTSVGFIGAGNMAAALIRGMLKSGFAASKLSVTDLDSAKTESLADELGVQAKKDARSVIENSDVIILAVKPYGVVPLLKSHATQSEGKLWLSVAAGVSTATMESALGAQARVVRVMPNTPALVGEGASGICPGKNALESDMSTAQRLLGAVGICEVVSEGMMDAVTGVSGSGPAYIFLVIEAMADGGVKAGLSRPEALRLAAQTVRGAASLMLETGKHPGELKDMVTSPGGTTIAGVEALEKSGLRSALMGAVSAAALRSKELSQA